ncbi:MAG: hypothetical protein LBL82_07935 [Oscillospiraceae bacterium]|nr:hypothetical protein [Oscillospiraceae bacterium]
MENNEITLSKEYAQITDLYFAVWSDSGTPVNYILLDFSAKRLERGEQAAAEDPIEKRRAPKDDQSDFVELIKYSADGTPIYNFDEPKKDEGQKPKDTRDVIADGDIEEFLSALQKVDIFSWRNNMPSNREGLSWRVDIYAANDFSKHMSGHARFPLDWSQFVTALNKLVERSCK